MSSQLRDSDVRISQLFYENKVLILSTLTSTSAFYSELAPKCIHTNNTQIYIGSNITKWEKPSRTSSSAICPWSATRQTGLPVNLYTRTDW